MGIDKQGSKSGGGYVGGFLQLFDWNGKSRKKLFTKSDLPEGSKQGKRNVGNLPTTRLRLIDDDENGGSSIRGSSDYSCASSVTDDDGNGTKAPGVVARLMGLDSLPTSSVVEPYSTPFFDTRSLRDSHSYRRSEFHSECQTMHSGSQPSMLDDFCRNPGEARLHKLHNRPIERFQTEMLPPKLAKSIPITHHKLLSPIKNPGFISAKNAAHIMEAAAKIIEPGPQPSTKGKIPSLGSPSVPLKVRDLKEKMEAGQRPSRLNGASRRPVESNAAKILKGQSLNKSWNGSEEPHRFRASSESEESSSVGSRSKGKSVSLAVQAKVNVQRREGFSSGDSRNLLSQKECQDLKSNQQQKNRSNTPKIMQKKSSTQNASGVLRQNNQKQNCLMNRDKLLTKASSNLQGRKNLSGDASFSRNKTLTKVAANSKVGSKKTGMEMTENEKEVPSLGTKSFPRKKRPIEGTCHFERGAVVENVLVDKDERPIQHNVGDSRRKGMDVVSFTFTSPMIRSTPGSLSSSPVVEKAKSFSLDSCDEKTTGSKNTKLSSLGLNVIGGDALSILLERKLRELTYGVESSCNNSVKSGSMSTSASILEDLVSALNAVGTTPREHNKRSHFGLHPDKLGNQYGSNCSSTYGEVFKMNHKLQVAEEMDTFSSISSEARKELECQHPSPVSILDPSFSNDSSNSSDTGGNNNTNGSKQCTFVQAQQVVDSKCPKRLPLMEAETDISDSASSTFIVTAGNENVAKLSMKEHRRSNKQEELGYIREIICNAELVFKDFMLGRTREIIDPSHFEQLENRITWSRSDSEEKNSRQRRKVLFDCVRECLDLRCKQFVGGGRRKWEKGVAMFVNKGWLVEDIYKEISGWGSMGDWMMDELVDKDMSSHYGRWLDFEIEEFEEGVEIENSIVSCLIDEVVADILLV
ncbi:protein of unknown function DUF4378 [Macleaya cordata]|uniref:DUF4378 domain-containing protein n=1 Tax=Macleaya cordata TaxID=56857 RepID=A0A200PWI1_MACCD|nr:protein of unknown function DUF4378 [Macleaya cordata]